MEAIFRTTQLLKSCRLCQTVRYASGSVRRREAREKRKEQVVQYQSVKATPAERVYVWGHAAAGALGVRSYLRPEKRHQKPVTVQHRPARLRFMDENDIEVYNVACGYGFTLFATKRRRRHLVFATGINTDSQLGYHEYPKNTGRVLDYIIEPVPVDIPGISQTDNKAVLQVACGRAHSVFLTKVGGTGHQIMPLDTKKKEEEKIFRKIHILAAPPVSGHLALAAKLSASLGWLLKTG